MIEVQAFARGPVFDGRAETAMDAFLQEANQEVADEGVSMIRNRLSGVLQHPTGAYQAAIHTERHGQDWQLLDDRGPKGPWLEGVSRRNSSTRFKGYHTFRLATQQLRAVAPDIAQRVLPPYLARMR